MIKLIKRSLIAYLWLMALIVAPSVNTYAIPKQTGVYKFELTELNGKKIPKPAIFYVYANSTKWTLDYRNGDKIVYTILSGNDYDPLCGLNAVDSFGDRCTICIKP